MATILLLFVWSKYNVHPNQKSAMFWASEIVYIGVARILAAGVHSFISGFIFRYRVLKGIWYGLYGEGATPLLRITVVHLYMLGLLPPVLKA